MKSAQPKSSVESTHSATSILSRDQKNNFFASKADAPQSFFSPTTIQPKLKIGQPGDKYEQEADRVADAVVNSPDAPNVQRRSVEEEEKMLQTQPLEEEEEELQAKREPGIQRKCGECEQEENLQTKQKPRGHTQSGVASSELSHQLKSKSGNGSRLPEGVQMEMSPKIGADFSGVNIHTDSNAHQMNQQLGARAFTHGSDIYFNKGEYNPASRSGQHLLAHELTHVVQQSQNQINCKLIQLTPSPQQDPIHGPILDQYSSETGIPRDQVSQHNPGYRQWLIDQTSQQGESALTGPLTEDEWQMVNRWIREGGVLVNEFTDDAEENAEIVAAGLFCHRRFKVKGLNNINEDPLLCIIPEVTRADPRVQQLVPRVTARGPIMNWEATSGDDRKLYVMELLVDNHGFPVNGAAGLVGNLWSESGVLPNRVEGSRPQTPMRAQNFQGQTTTFTAEEIMNRSRANRQGPRRPGVGLAQWTSQNRRTGLFQHQFRGITLDADILFNMDAQVDYLVTELQNDYNNVYQTITANGVSVNAAADEVVYRFEVPGSVLDANGNLLPRNDPAVQAVFRQRRNNAQDSLQVYQQNHP